MILSITDSGFDLAEFKRLVQAYEAYIGVSLAFQNLQAELGDLPGKFHPKDGGQLYLASIETEQGPQFVGCAGFYRFQETPALRASDLTSPICEVKRVYVDPNFQGRKLGVALMQRAMADASAMGYRTMLLDSLQRLEAARQLYVRLGFQEIAPYNENPHEDVYYMACDLTAIPAPLNV